MKSLFIAFAFIIACVSNTWGQKTALDSVYNLAIAQSGTGDVSGSTALLLTAQKMAEAENNRQMLCKIQVVLGKLAVIASNDSGIEETTRSALQLCSACNDTLSLARTYLQIGVLKSKREQYDSAIALFKLSSAYYLLKKDTMGAANAIAKVGNALEMQGRNQEAQVYYLQFYEAVKKAPNSPQFLTANIYLTANYLNVDQYDKAFEHNRQVKKLARQLNANFEYAQSLRYDAQIFKQLRQDAKAYDALCHYVAYYQDTLMNMIQLEQAEEMKAKYEAEKKETRLALQEAQLGREQLRFRILTGGLILALVAGGFLFALIRKLRKRNKEKEFLIKEIHHRVKNNLQILSSLLHLQSRQITDNTALEAVREGQNRVDAMGLIHQNLYMGDNLAKVEMKDYLEQFGRNMLDSFGIEDDRVHIEYGLDPLYLDVDTAIPLGLIINELTTNALKYAFPGDRPGVIIVSLWINEQNHLCLKVSDNGVGLANASKDDKSTSFGAELVQMLSKKLKGKPEILPQDQGYGTRIVFEKWS